MEYRVSLEERGIKSSEEIDKKVALLRKKLEADFGFVDGQWLPGQDRDTKALDGSRLSGDCKNSLPTWGVTPRTLLCSFLLGFELNIRLVLTGCGVWCCL